VSKKYKMQKKKNKGDKLQESTRCVFSLKIRLILLFIPWGTKFLRVLIFAIFAGFFAIRKNKFPQNKMTANFFPQKKFTPL